MTPERREAIFAINERMARDEFRQLVDDALDELLDDRTRVGYTEPVAFTAIAQARTRIHLALDKQEVP
jgi:hypothetical protein